MYLPLYIPLLLRPRLILSEVRLPYDGLFAFVIALFSVLTLVLANALVFQSNGGVILWLGKTAIDILGLLFTGAVYLPMVHLFAERALPESRISDLFTYAGLILAPLFLSLPLALILSLVPFGWALYLLALAVIFYKILFDLVVGVKENYCLPAFRAILATVAPLAVFIIVPALLGLFTLIINA